MRKLIYFLLGLGASSIIGCSPNPNVEYGTSQIGLRYLDKGDSKAAVYVRQTIPAVLKRYGEEIGSYTIIYEPVEIAFKNSQDMPEIPNPIPIELRQDRTKVPNEKAEDKKENTKDSGLDPEFVNPLDTFSIPFKIRGKLRVREGALDSLIASGKVIPIVEHSLDNVVVTFDTTNSVSMTGSGYKGVAYERNRGYSHFSPTVAPFSKERLSDNLKMMLKDTELKKNADELIWRIVQSEGIAGIFEKIEDYEIHNFPVTHFALVQERGYGLGDSSNFESKARSGLLSAEANSRSDTALKFTIHLSGILARENKQNANRR